MKKVLIISLILSLLAIGAYAWKRKKSKSIDSQNFGPDTVKKVYKKISTNTQKEWARQANNLLPNKATASETKTEFLKNLLTLQKESLIGIYYQHWNLYGQQQNRDLVDLIKNSPGVKGTQAQTNALTTLAKLIPTRKQQVKDLTPGELGTTLPTNLPLS